MPLPTPDERNQRHESDNNSHKSEMFLLQLESPGRKCAKLHTVAASSNRDHMPWSLYYGLLAPYLYVWVVFFALIPFVVNRTFNATPTERLQQFQPGAQPGGAFGAFVPPNISKHCIAILTFVETFKEPR